MNISASFIVLRAVRDWRPVGAAIIAASVGAIVLGPTNTNFLNLVAFYGPPIIAVTVISGLFEYSQRTSVWLMIAQRPGSVVRTMWSLLGAGVAVYLAASAVLVAALLVGVALNLEVAEGALRANALIFMLWVITVACAVSVTSTLARAGSAAIAVAWFLMPFLIGMLDDSIGFSGWSRTTLQFLAPPFWAVFEYPRVLSGSLPDKAMQHTLQLIWFPLYCLAILKWRLAVLSKPDQTRIE